MAREKAQRKIYIFVVKIVISDRRETLSIFTVSTKILIVMKTTIDSMVAIQGKIELGS